MVRARAPLFAPHAMVPSTGHGFSRQGRNHIVEPIDNPTPLMEQRHDYSPLQPDQAWPPFP
ncbi:protein of unknown function (plasmid) [Caballeronia sp. S22]